MSSGTAEPVTAAGGPGVADGASGARTMRCFGGGGLNAVAEDAMGADATGEGPSLRGESTGVAVVVGGANGVATTDGTGTGGKGGELPCTRARIQPTPPAAAMAMATNATHGHSPMRRRLSREAAGATADSPDVRAVESTGDVTLETLDGGPSAGSAGDCACVGEVDSPSEGASLGGGMLGGGMLGGAMLGGGMLGGGMLFRLGSARASQLRSASRC
jgi:hypothetical protein